MKDVDQATEVVERIVDALPDRLDAFGMAALFAMVLEGYMLSRKEATQVLQLADKLHSKTYQQADTAAQYH